MCNVYPPSHVVAVVLFSFRSFLVSLSSFCCCFFCSSFARRAIIGECRKKAHHYLSPSHLLDKRCVCTLCAEGEIVVEPGSVVCCMYVCVCGVHVLPDVLSGSRMLPDSRREGHTVCV